MFAQTANSRRTLLSLTAGAGLMLLLAACGGGSSDMSASSIAGASSAPTGSASTQSCGSSCGTVLATLTDAPGDFERWCAGRTTNEALEILGKAMIPAGPVLKPQQVLDDPHVQAMNFFQPIDYPGLPRAAPVTRAAVNLSETPGAIEHRPPMLGEHTDAILEALGYDVGAIAALRDQGVI